MYDALRGVRPQLEDAISNGLQAASLDDRTANRRAVLANVIQELEKAGENTSSITEKMWYRRFVDEAKLMFDELG